MQPRDGGCGGTAALGDWFGFAGEDGFIRIEAACRGQQTVRRHAVARLDRDAVPRHKLLRRQLLQPSVPPDLRRGGGHVPQSLEGFFRAVLLHKAEHGIEQHDDADGHGIRPFAEKRRHACTCQQDEHHNITKLSKKDAHRPRRLHLHEGIFAVFPQPFSGLRLCESVHTLCLLTWDTSRNWSCTIV